MDESRSDSSKYGHEAWICASCGKTHSDVPLSFSADFPDMYASLSADDRDLRAVISSDQCVLDEKWFFVRGCLEIPVHGHDEPFLWGVWVSVREEVFDQISDSWTLEGREKTHGPFKGRLANSLRVYPETLNLKIEIRIQPAGTRPLLVIEEPEHEFAIDQQNGITWTRAMKLVSLLLHETGKGRQMHTKSKDPS